MTKRKIAYWVIPPDADGEFVACMEDVLEVNARPYDENYPVLNMDEQPIQLTKDARRPIPATKHHPKRVDYEYERAGTASIFMFNEALSGWRKVSVRPRRTKIDWAMEMKALLCTRYANVKKVILICDNLNTHTPGAFYEAFEPKEARALLSRIEFHYTPKHGSWLNIAENELSAMTRQCLTGRRFGKIETLRQEVEAWARHTNSDQRVVDWKFKIKDARRKLKTAYPNL